MSGIELPFFRIRILFCQYTGNINLMLNSLKNGALLHHIPNKRAKLARYLRKITSPVNGLVINKLGRQSTS